ncbi:PLP-dependent aminotransferase family protein [Tardiphaga sp. 709]|uniref:MocR-like pyridoxine biosynthesis transcription factor PdxR n=1 Tax=Tardiphaga sp. 709 TaxID=3076039 RepID=UPI0039657E54
MPRLKSSFALPSLKTLDRTSGRVGHQLAQGLRDAITIGDLKPGERLPSTRTLAISLGLARGTIVEAFEQLKAEGYLEALPRAGTAVVRDLKRVDVPASSGPLQIKPRTSGKMPFNARKFAAAEQLLQPQPGLPFAIAHPADAAAPDATWRRLGNRVRATRAAAPSGYVDPRGLPELRKAISDHVRKVRAVRCTPEQVIITAGTQQGLFLAATVLVGRGDAVWVEDPAYPGITAVLQALDVTTHHVPVDLNGIDVDWAVNACPDARAAFVTPSHQYPIGMPMSMSRRLALLRWAQDSDGWIIEDDYDSELRYSGHPFPSLQGLDPTRVVYLGTMSKVLFSSMRIGYAIVPEPLVAAFAGARAIVDRHSPAADQHVLAAFMDEGHLEAHIRRIRSAYAERRTFLIEAISREFPEWAVLQPSDQGMHLVVWLPKKVDDVKVAGEARSAGIVVRAVSPLYASKKRRSGLMLGFGGFSIKDLDVFAKRLGAILKRHEVD